MDVGNTRVARAGQLHLLGKGSDTVHTVPEARLWHGSWFEFYVYRLLSPLQFLRIFFDVIKIASTTLPSQPESMNTSSMPNAVHTLRDRLGLRRAAGLLAAIAIVYILVVVIAPPDTFASYRNMTGLLRSMSTMAIIAMGTSLVIVVGEIDLSFGFVYGLAGMVLAVTWLVLGWPLPLAIATAFAVSALVGSFNAFLTTVVGIPSFIATLGSGTLCFGITLFVSESRTYTLSSVAKTMDPAILAIFRSISTAELPFGIPPQGLWMLLLAVIFIYVLDLSLFGFRLKAIGGNQRAAALAGLPVVKYKWAAFASSKFLWPPWLLLSILPSSAWHSQTPARP